MLPYTYITKNGLKYIESLTKVRANVDNNKNIGMIQKHDSRALNAINKFPLFLNNRRYKSKQIKFYERYLCLKVAKQLFINLLTILQRNDNQQKYSSAKLKIQPQLLNKIEAGFQIHKNKMVINKIQIKSTRIISQQIIHGIFIHRKLNMPKQCYSIQVKNQNEVYFRIRERLRRHQHMAMMEKKKIIYNENDYRYERFYVDSYQNFAKYQKIKRVFVQINSKIWGKVILNQLEIQLPLYMLQPITSHLMQIQIVQMNNRSQKDRAILTDIDFFMKGNPFII